MAPDRPNLLFVLTDQQCADALSCAGNPWVSTPNLDRLAARGVRFSASYCAFTLCTPARGSIFSGRMPHQHEAVSVSGRYGEMREDLLPHTAGRVMNTAGYQCAYGGKWHLGRGEPGCSIDGRGLHGFERICGLNDVKLAEACVEFLTRRDRARPFFLVASFDDPHNICEWAHGVSLPWGELPEPPREEDCPPLPVNFAREPYQPTAVKLAYDKRRAGHFDVDWSLREWRQYRWAYYRLVERVDQRIGVLLDGLDALGLTDSTLIVFTSDHGEQLGAHGLQQKMVMYEESVRVPLIVVAPGSDREARRGVVCDVPVSAGIDLMPTWCDYAGVTPPADLPGRSLPPLVARDDDAERAARAAGVFVEMCGTPDWRGLIGDGARMVRSHRFKYVVFHHGRPNEQLFDLHNDPGEMVNRAFCSTYRDTLTHHRDPLRAWMHRTADRFGSTHYAFVPSSLDHALLPGDRYPIKDTPQ